jgi:hypothetical protein
MWGRASIFLGMLAWLATPVQAATNETGRLSYDIYAAGLHVAEVEASFAIGPRIYQMDLSYHTTGLAGFFYRGRQVSAVNGTWQADHAQPASFVADGVWRGEDRIARIDYERGIPIIRQLIPPNEAEREAVPPALQAHSVDTLSALLELVQTVTRTGRCEQTARIYDGRRATELEAHTVGEEMLTHNGRSAFEGQALRCDFAGRIVAGFRFGDTAAEMRPLRGSAWLARVTPDGPLLPVRMTYETRWFGDAMIYLTGTGNGGSVAKN